MSKNKILLLIFTFASGGSCSLDDKEYETHNIPTEIKVCLEKNYENREDTVLNWRKVESKDADFIIYKFKDAGTLPSSNLLDNTWKVRFVLYEKEDSVGNPLYAVQLLKSEKSEWKRVWNLGSTSFYSDSLLNMNEICYRFSDRLLFQNWKMLP